MCWISITPPTLLTAEKNIEIFKVGIDNFRSMYSPFRNFKYLLGFRYEEDCLYPMPINNRYEIHSGFHSYDPRILQFYKNYDSIIVAKGSLRVWTYGSHMSVFKGFIPKGAFYYSNMSGELVSDQIVITNKIK
jgi:hypothetical protein